MPLIFKNKAYVENKDPLLAEALSDLAKHIETVMKHTNVTPRGESEAPPAIAGMSVSAAQGIFDIAIHDNNSPVSRGINYFVEYSKSPSFVSPIVIDLGASRNWRGLLGSQTLYFRAYSAYPTSERSTPYTYNTNGQPTPVLGGGTVSGPDPLPSSGSGTTKGGSGSDGGFGKNQLR